MSTTSDSEGFMVADSHMLMLGFGAIFGLVLLICAIYIYVKFRGICNPENDNVLRNSFHPTGGSASRNAMERRQRRVRALINHPWTEIADKHAGLHKSVIEQLPTFVLSAENDVEHDLECAVCLEKLTEGRTGKILPECSHCFHLECIDMWLFSHSSCPLCRCEVASPQFTPTPNSMGMPIVTEFTAAHHGSLSGQGSEASAPTMLNIPSAANEHPALYDSLSQIQHAVEMSTVIFVHGQSRDQVFFPAGSHQQQDDASAVPFWNRELHEQLEPNTLQSSSGLPHLRLTTA